ncbi:hypothetical protein TorRG33x02_278480 [Trema orientale]|uniref:Uncharacterized protein n=1 Tax=Trema orientale TaxID=63057 RepID=A0A2P5CNP9_TREOI|nr:hypothetical protein TorRG33x02_278480 [Trema orientale]
MHTSYMQTEVQTPNCDKSLVKPTCDRYIQQIKRRSSQGLRDNTTRHVSRHKWLVHATKGEAIRAAFIDCNAFPQQLLPPSFNAIPIIHTHIQHTPSLSPIQLSKTPHDGASISIAAF